MTADADADADAACSGGDPVWGLFGLLPLSGVLPEPPPPPRWGVVAAGFLAKSWCSPPSAAAAEEAAADAAESFPEEPAPAACLLLLVPLLPLFRPLRFRPLGDFFLPPEAAPPAVRTRGCSVLIWYYVVLYAPRHEMC